VLALQRSAGNQAVTRLLANRGSPRAAIQRTPTTWAADQRAQAVVTLKKGKALTSWWPAIVRLTSGYGQVADHDRASRATTLTRLEAAIAAWRTHQQSAWVKNTKLVSDKKTALTALEQLIAAERQELQQALRPPATAPRPSSANTGPPAPMRGMPRPSSSLAIPSRGDAPRWVEDEAPQEDVFHLDLGDESFSEEPEVLETEKTLEKEKQKPVGSQEKVEDDEDDSESESEEAEPEIKLPEMPTGVHVQVHLTKTAYLPGIRAEGLIPGKQQGIGDPDTRKPDPGNIYVIDEEIQAPELSPISMDSGGQPVVVLAASPGSRDVNYKQGAVTPRGVLRPCGPPPRRRRSAPAATRSRCP